MKKLPIGKLPPDFLQELLERFQYSDKNILIGASYGVDGCVIRSGGVEVALTTDPITFTTQELPYYLIGVNVNDIMCMGALPEYMLANLFFPPGTSEEYVRETFDKINEIASRYNLKIVGGHTEITYGIDRTIASAFIIGRVIKNIGPANVVPGDSIVLVKGIAIEGTSILAREKEDELLKKLSPNIIERAKKFLFDPGIIIFNEAIIALEKFDIHNMHDPTEGGIFTALYETLFASHKGGLIYIDNIPIYEETRVLCEIFGVDPFGLLASGSLIIILPEDEASKLVDEYRKNGIEANIIGKVMEREYGIKLLNKGKIEDLKPFERDEIVRVLE